MNPIAAIVASLVALKDELYTRFNAALGKLPPLEQIEGGNSVLSVIREVEWAGERMKRVGDDLQTTLDAAAERLTAFERKAGESVDVAASRLMDILLADSATAAIGAAIAAKTHLPIEDHHTALTAAIDQTRATVRGEVEVEFNARIESMQTLATRRNEVTERLGAIAAAAITDADLLAENHAEVIAAVESRIATLSASGITPESHPRNFGSLLACGLDETGTAQFDSRLEMLKEATALSASAPATKPEPTTPAGTLPPTPTKATPSVII